MHRLLMERGEIIDRLIAVKRTQETGSAFRPAREADMMRRLVERHQGILPLDTAESIWRVIIATFTYVQAPFSVHADLSAGEAGMRDRARFHFGFTVPFVPHMGAASVVAAVSDSKGDLGLVPAFAMAGGGAWWNALEFDRRPRSSRDCRSSIAPTIRPPCRCSWCRAPRRDAMVREVETWSVRVAGWSAGAAQAVGVLAEVIAVPDRAFDGAALLISVPQGGSIDRRHRRLDRGRGIVRASALVGSHATRYRVPAEGARVPDADRSPSGVSNVRPASATASRRARYRPLCAGQEHGAGGGARVQAVLERDAARPEPEGDRRLQRGRASIWRTIRMAPRPTCARQSGALSGSIPIASSAAPARTISST